MEEREVKKVFWRGNNICALAYSTVMYLSDSVTNCKGKNRNLSPIHLLNDIVFNINDKERGISYFY